MYKLSKSQTKELLNVHCYQVYCLFSLFRFDIKGHQCCICNAKVVKSAFSHVFKNSEAMAIENEIFLLIKQQTAKEFSTLILF